MSARGPSPTPTPILEARGSWRAKERAGEPRPPVKAPSCPAWLGKEAKAEWKRQVKLLVAAGVLAELDRAALAAWCEAWEEFVLARHVIAHGEPDGANKGHVVRGSAGSFVVSPWVRVKNAAVQRLLQLAAQFGFTPAARARLQVAGEDAGELDERERFFGTVG